MALTPNQLAALPTQARIFGTQTVAGYNKGEQYKAFICYGCLDCDLYTTPNSYPHFLSIELIDPKVKP